MRKRPCFGLHHAVAGAPRLDFGLRRVGHLAGTQFVAAKLGKNEEASRFAIKDETSLEEESGDFSSANKQTEDWHEKEHWLYKFLHRVLELDETVLSLLSDRSSDDGDVVINES